jgi:hypothetical protein
MGYKIPHMIFVQTNLVGTSFFPVAQTMTGLRNITTEGDAQVRMSHAGKLSNLKLYINNTGLGGLVLMLRVNGADTALSLTTAATVGINQNITDEVYVQVGDLVCLRLGTIAASTNRIISASIDFEADGDKSILYIANMRRQALSLTASTRIEPCGDIDNFAVPTEANAQGALRHKCRLLNWHANVDLNTRNSATTVDFRQNGTDAATITVPASTTGRFNLDTNVNLQFDDLINTNLTLSAGTGSILFFMIQATLESDNPRELTVFGGRPGTQSALRYIGFSPGISNVTANRSFVIHITKPMVIDLFKFRLSANTQTSPFTASVRTSSNTIFSFTEVTCFDTTVPASTTGWFENNADSYTLVNNQFIYTRFTRNDGSYTLEGMSTRLTLPAEVKVYQTTNHAI